MAELLFPERQRCAKCGKGLGADGAPVLFGKFDTPKCAGLAEPVTDPSKAPRWCVTMREDHWVFKHRYRSDSEMPRRIADDPQVDKYWCDHCGHRHVGRTRVAEVVEGRSKPHRKAMDRADVADILVKLRGNATHKTVAEVAGVRPIRIKEWEDPKFDAPSLEVLFKLLKVYRAEAVFFFRQA